MSIIQTEMFPYPVYTNPETRVPPDMKGGSCITSKIVAVVAELRSSEGHVNSGKPRY